jgi:hypothetical protein
MNVHKRCQKNVANNCGINTKQMAEILSAMGISTYKLTPKRSKVCLKIICFVIKSSKAKLMKEKYRRSQLGPYHN